MGVYIKGVDENSPAYKAGIRAGMQLLQLDGHVILDGLDYEFYAAPAQLQVLVQDGEETLRLHIEKQEYQALGCQFESYLIDKHHTCRNKCVFCFVDQLPKGLRKPLYFKDDDERLSFLFGNYVTLTNLTQREVDRIIAMRISPINISVHATNPDLRVRMMGNKQAGDVLRFIPELAAAGTVINTQLVLCPGLNDGEELLRSIEWLAQWQPALQSIAVVPVGLSRFRQGLYPLQAYTKESAAKQLDSMLHVGNQLKKQTGNRLVYPSDEWFLKAARELPPEDFYDGYLQLENGVGMWRLLEDEFMQALEETLGSDKKSAADIVTGASAAGLLQKLAGAVQKKFPRVKVRVHRVENDFFGRDITVAGLLTGRDIVQQLRGKLQSGRVLLPAALLRAEGDLLLDGTTPEEIAEALQAQVEIVPQSGEDLLAAMLELDDDFE